MLIIAIMVIVGLMSGVLSNTGTAAVLIPVVIGIAAKSVPDLFPYPLRRFRIKAYIAVKLVFEIAQHIAYAAELVGRDKPHLVCFFICRLRKDDAEKQP